MENDTKGFKDTEERLIEIKYIGLGGLEKAKRGTLMLFCPADLYETFMEDREHSRVPLLPVPVPPFSDGLYTRRLVAVAGGDDPDGDIFEGYTRVAGVRIKRITLRSAPQGIYGRMTVVTSEDEEAEVPINFEYTIVEAVLAGIPIFIITRRRAIRRKADENDRVVFTRTEKWAAVIICIIAIVSILSMSSHYIPGDKQFNKWIKMEVTKVVLDVE